MTKDETKAKNIAKMGQALGEVYTELWQEVARLFSKWMSYVELFGTKESRIGIMNKAAPDFFGKLQDSQFREVLLDIACLTDRPEIGGRKNLSFQSLPALVNDLVLKQRTIDLVAEALTKAAFARDWRNRYLAHRDLSLALGRAKPLEAASRATTRAALDSLAAVLNEIDGHYNDSTTKFDLVITPYGGALTLLHILDDGVYEDDQRRQRFDSGAPLQRDYSRDI